MARLSTQKILRTQINTLRMNKFSEVIEYNINIKNLIAFQYITRKI